MTGTDEKNVQEITGSVMDTAGAVKPIATSDVPSSTEATPEQPETKAKEITWACEEAGPCRRRFKITIPATRIKNEIEERYKEIATTAAVPGFRKGRAPRKLLVSKFGKEINIEVTSTLVEESISTVINGTHIRPVLPPRVEIDKIDLGEGQKDVTFEFTVDVYPEVRLESWRGIEIQKPTLKVTEEDIDEAIDSIRKAKAELVITEEPVKNGDLVICDIEFKSGGKTLKTSTNNAITIGSSSLIGMLSASELATHLSGFKAGDSKTIPVNIPAGLTKEIREECAGEITINLKEVKKLSLPDVTDEWAREMGYESVLDLRAKLRNDLEREFQRRITQFVEDLILDKLVEASNFDVPEVLVNTFEEQLLSRIRLDMFYRGQPISEIQKQEETLKKEGREAILRRIRADFIIEHIAKEEKIFITEDMVNARISEIAARTKMWPNEVREYLEKNDLLKHLRSKMKEEMVKECLRKHARIIEPAN